VQSRNKAQGDLRSNLIILFGVAGAVYLIGAVTDLSERVWVFLRSFESVELDELVVAGVSMLVAGLVVAQRRISALKARVVELESVRHQTSTPMTPDRDLTDCVIKCVGCGKYQIHGEHWINLEDFSTLTKQNDVLGGVCPNCRPASGG